MSTTRTMDTDAAARATSATTTMLEIATAVLRCRAKIGGERGTYDLAADPEGYITSVLTGLMHWCHANQLNWLEELGNAWGHFEQDLREDGHMPPEFTAITVRDLQCPKCGHRESFVIEMSECFLIFHDGIELHGDAGEEWGLNSYCRCHACDHAGMVYQFHPAKATSEEDADHG